MSTPGRPLASAAAERTSAGDSSRPRCIPSQLSSMPMGEHDQAERRGWGVPVIAIGPQGRRRRRSYLNLPHRSPRCPFPARCWSCPGQCATGAPPSSAGAASCRGSAVCAYSRDTHRRPTESPTLRSQGSGPFEVGNPSPRDGRPIPVESKFDEPNHRRSSRGPLRRCPLAQGTARVSPLRTVSSRLRWSIV